MTNVTRSCHMMESHDDCGNIVHRPYSSCISSVQESNENSIEFSLSTQIRSRIKCSLLSLTYHTLNHYYLRNRHNQCPT